MKGVVSLGSMLFSMKERILEMFVQMLKKAAWKIPIQLICMSNGSRQNSFQDRKYFGFIPWIDIKRSKYSVRRGSAPPTLVFDIRYQEIHHTIVKLGSCSHSWSSLVSVKTQKNSFQFNVSNLILKSQKKKEQS